MSRLYSSYEYDIILQKKDNTWIREKLLQIMGFVFCTLHSSISRHLRPMNATEQPLIVVVEVRLVMMVVVLVALLRRLWHLDIVIILIIHLVRRRRPPLTRAQCIMIRMGLSVEPQPKHFVSRQIRT